MDRVLLTPFLLDRPAPALRRLAGPDTWINPATPGDGPTLKRIATIHESLAAAVHETVRAGQRPVSIAGDCFAPLGVLAGLERAGLAPRLLWLDAHGDFNTTETTPSGFLGGMPLAMLVGRGDTTVTETLGKRFMPESDILLSDARDLDPGEALALESSNVRRFATLAELKKVPLGDRPLHVHLDVDVMSLEDVPAVSYPARGGPRLSELLELGRHLAATSRPAAFSMTLWAFDRDPDRRSEAACLKAMAAFLGDG